MTICCDFAECFVDLFLIVCRLLFGEEGKKLDGIWAQQMTSARYVYACTLVLKSRLGSL